MSRINYAVELEKIVRLRYKLAVALMASVLLLIFFALALALFDLPLGLMFVPMFLILISSGGIIILDNKRSSLRSQAILNSTSQDDLIAAQRDYTPRRTPNPLLDGNDELL